MESNLSSTMLCNNIAGLFDEKLKSNNYNVNQSWIDLFQNQTKQWLTSEHLRPLVFGFYHSYLIELTDLNIYFKIFLYLVYACIFTIGLIGNILVCYVIFRQSSMHSVTYIYIANLALVDILICLFAVPFTPMYLMTFKEWIFGTTLCRLVPFAQAMSIYISTFTLMSIAIERYMVIVHPYKQQIELVSSVVIICIIWVLAFIFTLPYGVFIDVIPMILLPLSFGKSSNNENGANNLNESTSVQMEKIQDAFQSCRTKLLCDEMWPNNELRIAFGMITSMIQFVVPFCIITFCYMKVCFRLWNRVQTRPGSRNCSSQRKWLEKERARRMNMMLIFMVVIFAVSWLPLNTYNLIEDFDIGLTHWKHSRTVFMSFHAIAMSSTCYNPFLYSWLNYNFRKEFKSIFMPLCNRCFITNSVQMNKGNNMIRPTFIVGWRKHKNQLANCERTGNSMDTNLQNHSRFTKNSTQITSIDPNSRKFKDDDDQISFTVLDTTTNLVTNMESINEAELQESLLVTSIRNGMYANRVVQGSSM